MAIVDLYPAHHALISDRIGKLLECLSRHLHERDHAVRLTLLATLCGEHVFLYGPPGVAKSQLAKRISGLFDSPQYFEYLLHRFATPEELFGPLSIPALKNEGRYERLTEHYLPTATFAFLDEIWKSSPAILNTLLTLLNERQFKNGHQQLDCPLHSVIGAANEFPEPHAGLAPLFDRFLIRIKLTPITEKRSFKGLLHTPNQAWHCPDALKIQQSEYQTWQYQQQQVLLEEQTFEVLYELKQNLKQDLPNIAERISDRRWKQAIDLLKAAAFFNGRDTINTMDLLLLKDCFWFDEESEEALTAWFSQWATEQTFQQQQQHTQQTQLIEQMEQDWQHFSQKLACQYQSFTRFNKVLFQCMSLFEQPVYEMAYKKNWIKLLILQPSHQIHDQIPQVGKWLYLKQEELSNLQSEAKLVGFLNDNPNLLSFKIELDANHKLIVRDAEHRPLYLALENTLNHRPFWDTLKHQYEAILTQLNDMQQQQQAQQTTFHLQRQHHFLDPNLLDTIEKGFLSSHEQASEDLQQWQSYKELLNNPLGYYAISGGGFNG